MPRQARVKSESGYTHLIVRGIGRQVLFEAREDYQFYLAILERYSHETEIQVCAYCLMENHVHLLVCDANARIASMMKKLGVSYSQYFNRKYKRQGHLFQDRYLSEPIDDERYLLTVFRYILNNPQKVGISTADYEWSSYRLFAQPSPIVDTRVFRELIGDEEQYVAYLAMPNDDHCLEYERRRKDDEWAREIIRKRLGGKSGTVLQSFERAERNKVLAQLLKDGLSIRQVERLTGISRGIVQSIKS